MIQEQAHAPRTPAAVLCTLQSGRQEDFCLQRQCLNEQWISKVKSVISMSRTDTFKNSNV